MAKNPFVWNRGEFGGHVTKFFSILLGEWGKLGAWRGWVVLLCLSTLIMSLNEGPVLCPFSRVARIGDLTRTL